MSSKGISRDFKQILRACSIQPCKVKFQTNQKVFERSDGSTYSIQIVDGVCQSQEQSPPKSKQSTRNRTHRGTNHLQKDNENSHDNSENNQSQDLNQPMEENHTQDSNQSTEGNQSQDSNQSIEAISNHITKVLASELSVNQSNKNTQNDQNEEQHMDSNENENQDKNATPDSKSNEEEIANSNEVKNDENTDKSNENTNKNDENTYTNDEKTDKNDENTDKSDSQNNNDNEESNYDRIIEVDNREIIAEDGDPFIDDIISISEYLKTSVSQLYDVTPISAHFKFGIKEEDESITFIDGTIQTTSNGLTKQLFNDIPGGEEQLNDLITSELSSTPDEHKCASNLKTCSKPNYLVPRIYVILHKARSLYPKVDQSRLYRVIKNRLQSLDSDVLNQKIPVCIKCLHIYVAQQRQKQGSKETNKLEASLDPYPFESLTPAEISQKGKKDVGSTQDMHKPFSFGINFMDNPYRSKLPFISKYVKPKKEEKKEYKEKEPEWVERLSSPYKQRAVSVPPNSKKVPFVKHKEPEPLPKVTPIRCASSQNASRFYKNSPFDYSFIDKTKARTIARMRKSGTLH